jgi:aspartyl-tRNA(Asn)/glutamyl-tRNA(Gln) amidotransferase subunit A
MTNYPHSITEARSMLKQGIISSVDLTQKYLDRIAALDGEIHAYLGVYDDVLDQARLADEQIAAGIDAPLLGVPLSIKDNILFQGHTASAASKILGNYTASYTAHIVEELQKAGAVLIGRTNMDEFAMGGSCENSAYGPTYNPLDTARVPGGSSGGAAAAVAADMCTAAIGTDTGGSVRLPAAFCGLCGLYPTYGSTSRYGLIAMGSSFDQAGPIARSVDDCQILHSVLSTYDARDAQCIPLSARKNVSSKVATIGVPRSLLAMDGVSDSVRSEFENMLALLQQKGYKVVDIDLPHITASVPVYYVIIPAEVSTNLSRIDGIRYGDRKDGVDLLDVYMNTKGEGFGAEAQRRILLGTYVLSAGYYDAYYGKATQVRQIIRSEIIQSFDIVDVILTPTAGIIAPKIGEKSDPASMYMMDIFTVSANLSGAPALSVPFGKDAETGMPFGMHIMAPHWGEERLFVLGKDIESLGKTE